MSNQQTKPFQKYADIDVDEVLAERGQIGLIWDIHDVKSVRPDLSNEHAWKVLDISAVHYDPSGSFWEVIEKVADEMYPDDENVDDE
jgi:hypothetical protein